MGSIDKYKNRIIGLDWLRGFCAISIMTYHYIGNNSHFTFLSKLGIYGVSIFFILSGLSMAIVYNRFIHDIKSALNFYIRRAFRIIPLHAIVCILVIIPILYNTKTYDWTKLFLNITTLFGFIAPNKYIAMGAWSIGNEMFYYFFTPVILMLYNYKKNVGNIFMFISIIVGFYFSFIRLDETQTLANQWKIYVNPFNNFFLYYIGIGLYYNFSELNIDKKLNTIILIFALLVFTFLPYNGQIFIVTKYNRIIYSFLSVIIVFCFYKLKIKNANIVGKVFEQFGIATYGVYLLHPISLYYLSLLIQNTKVLLVLSFSFTISIALVSYYFIEYKLISIGKQIQLK